MRTMDIGRLNKRITFMKLADMPDAMGQESKKLREIKTVWGSLYPVRGMEFYELQKMQSKITHKCYVRYMEGIGSECYIRYGEKTYSIESVLDIDLAHKMLEIMCSEHSGKEMIADG